MDLPKRKPNRLHGFDYSTPGAYFITICTEEKKNILGSIVGGGALDAPQIRLSPMGHIAKKYLLSGNKNRYVHIDKYVIMPNHIHFILMVDEEAPGGTSRVPSPTNAVVPRFVSTFKRFCHKDADKTLFQRSYHDHIIRNEQDYLKIWAYIDSNPAKWKEDCFYKEEPL